MCRAQPPHPFIAHTKKIEAVALKTDTQNGRNGLRLTTSPFLRALMAGLASGQMGDKSIPGLPKRTRVHEHAIGSDADAYCPIPDLRIPLYRLCCAAAKETDTRKQRVLVNAWKRIVLQEIFFGDGSDPLDPVVGKDASNVGYRRRNAFNLLPSEYGELVWVKTRNGHTYTCRLRLTETLLTLGKPGNSIDTYVLHYSEVRGLAALEAVCYASTEYNSAQYVKRGGIDIRSKVQFSFYPKDVDESTPVDRAVSIVVNGRTSVQRLAGLPNVVGSELPKRQGPDQIMLFEQMMGEGGLGVLGGAHPSILDYSTGARSLYQPGENGVYTFYREQSEGSSDYRNNSVFLPLTSDQRNTGRTAYDDEALASIAWVLSMDTKDAVQMFRKTLSYVPFTPDPYKKPRKRPNGKMRDGHSLRKLKRCQEYCRTVAKQTRRREEVKEVIPVVNPYAVWPYSKHSSAT